MARVISSLQKITGTFQVVANNNSRSLIIADTYSDSALSNSISIKKSRGTNITPLKVVSGDSIKPCKRTRSNLAWKIQEQTGNRPHLFR